MPTTFLCGQVKYDSLGFMCSEEKNITAIAVYAQENLTCAAGAFAGFINDGDYNGLRAEINPPLSGISDNADFLCAVCFGVPDGNNEDKIRELPVIRIKTDKSPVSGTVVLSAPCRAGAIIDEIERIRDINRSASDARIKMGDMVLDTKAGVISGSGFDDIRITEKEQAVLIYLHNHSTATVGKEELLREVWHYADGIDTHTIETHIYRLRQKIEKQSGRAEFLVTEEGGYRLSFNRD